MLDGTTLEWTDGVFTGVLRQVLNNVRGEASRRQWIVFDGDVDPEWAENLNSVLDDNRLLTLPSGERLAIPSNVRIMFEVESLRYATLATVSRCGMVWFSEQTLSTDMIFRHAVMDMRTRHGQTLPVEPEGGDEPGSRALGAGAAADGAGIGAGAGAAAAQYVAPTVYSQAIDILEPFLIGDGAVVQAALEWVLPQEHCMEVTRVGLIMSAMAQVECGVEAVAAYNDSHPDFPLAVDVMQSYLGKWAIASIVFAFGASLPSKLRLDLCEHLGRIATVPLPTPAEDESLMDYEVVVDTGEWRRWAESVPTVDLESHRVLATDVVVATVDTVRHDAMLRNWLSFHLPVILCGPPGSGKTMTLTYTLQSMPELELVSLNFSAASTPDLILKTFEQHCVYVARVVLLHRPPAKLSHPPPAATSPCTQVHAHVIGYDTAAESRRQVAGHLLRRNQPAGERPVRYAPSLVRSLHVPPTLAHTPSPHAPGAPRTTSGTARRRLSPSYGS